MKKFLIIVLIGTLWGCATAPKPPAEQTIRQKTEIFYAYDTGKNLQGYTKEEIMQRFGPPDISEKAKLYDNRVDIWYYKDIYYNVKIKFINDIVTEVEYN